MSNRNFVTGATGFIGRALCAGLQEKGEAVVACGRKIVGGPWQSFIEADLTASDFGVDLAGVDTVYHLAGKAHALSEQPNSMDGYQEVIVDGTRRLLAAAEQAGVKKFIYVSSVKAMGEGHGSEQSNAVNEDATPEPTSPYGIAKRMAEELVLQSKIPHVSIIRPVMVYGPGHKGNLVRMAEAIRGHRFPPLRNNGNRRSMVHVDDLVVACMSAAVIDVANRETFIIAGNRAPSTRELYDALRVELELSPVKFSVPDVLLQVGAMSGDLLGRLLRRRMPLDSDTLNKLVSSAWYANDKSKNLLNIDYSNELRPYLEGAI